MRQRREHDDDLEARGAAYVSTFRWGEGRPAISSTAGIDDVSTLDLPAAFLAVCVM